MSHISDIAMHELMNAISQIENNMLVNNNLNLTGLTDNVQVNEQVIRTLVEELVEKYSLDDFSFN